MISFISNPNKLKFVKIFQDPTIKSQVLITMVIKKIMVLILIVYACKKRKNNIPKVFLIQDKVKLQTSLRH